MSGEDVDVVVVGAGAAGFTAALTAKAAGAEVVVAESESVVGGAARLSGGWVMAAGTDIQRRAQIRDSAEALFHEYMFINQFELQPTLVRRLAEDSGGVIAWLSGLGVGFSPDVMQGGPELVPRTHVAEGAGQGVVDVLYRECRNQDIDVALGRRVDRLVYQGDAVGGVAVGDDEMRAGAVVLATGGFGANPSLIEQHLPSVAGLGDWVFYIGPESCRGDALALAESAGAATVGRDRFISQLVPRLDTRDFDAFVPAWLLVVGPDGRRLCDETGPYGITCGLATSAGGRVFGLFDDRTLADNGSPQLPTFKPYRNGMLRQVTLWTTDGIRRLLNSGAIVRADTLEDLASKLGIPATATIGTVRRYNQSAAEGKDRDFDKDARFIRPLEVAPFYGVELRPAALGLTNYGLQIDDTGHVLNQSQAPIEGLYAAGACTGGVIGPRYLSSGNSLANCFVFGRTAGHAAATHALAR